MKTKATSPLSLCNICCAVLALILLILQFTPFWTPGEGAAPVSIGGYVWFPTEHADLTSYIQQNTDSAFTINAIVIPAVLMLALSAAGAVLGVLKRDEFWAGVFPIACGISGLWGFLSQPALRLGSTWVLQLVLCILMLALGVFGMVKESQASRSA